MKITAVKVHQATLPLRKGYSLSGGRLHLDRLDSTLVELETDEGLTCLPADVSGEPAYAEAPADAHEPPSARSAPPNRSGRILSTLIASTRISRETATPPTPRRSSGGLAR